MKIFLRLLIILRGVFYRFGDLIYTFSFRCAYRMDAGIVRYGVYLSPDAQVSFGRKIQLGRKVRLVTELRTAKIRIGDDVQINEQAMIDYTGGIEIGSEVVISRNAYIITHDHGLDPHSEPFPRSLKIGDKAWIGANVLILPSTSSIGVGAIIGAGTVVTKPVPDYAVVVGNPARVIRLTRE